MDVPLYRVHRPLVDARYFVIAILVAVVNFGRLASVEANLGAIAFASVVILTMLAAVTFDPRLIWDNTESDDDHD